MKAPFLVFPAAARSSTYLSFLSFLLSFPAKAFLPLGEDADDPTLPGELAYIDDAGAVCRCWNWRDGQRTALTDDSRNAFLIIECVEPARVDDCRAAIDELAELVERYLGATIAVKDVITREHREVVIAQ